MIRRKPDEAMAALKKRLFDASRAELEALIDGRFTDATTRDLAQQELNVRDRVKRVRSAR